MVVVVVVAVVVLVLVLLVVVLVALIETSVGEGSFQGRIGFRRAEGASGVGRNKSMGLCVLGVARIQETGALLWRKLSPPRVLYQSYSIGSCKHVVFVFICVVVFV